MSQNNQPNEPTQTPPESQGQFRIAPANRGIEWLKDAYGLVKQSLGAWIGVASFLLLMMMIPYINIISAILIPVAMGGIMIGCRQHQNGVTFKFDHLFEGVKHDAKPLLLLSLYYGLASIAINILTYLILLLVGIDYHQVQADLTPSKEFTTQQEMLDWFNQLMAGDTLLYLALGMLVSLALYIPVFMALWFAPGLIVFQQMKPLNAALTSYQACRKNFIPFLVLGLLGFAYLMAGYFLLLMLAVLLPLLGVPLFIFSFLMIFAISLATIYPTYCDLFEQKDQDSGVIPDQDGDSSMLA